MKINLFLISILVALACICSDIGGYYVGRKDRINPVVVEFDGHKTNLYKALNIMEMLLQIGKSRYI